MTFLLVFESDVQLSPTPMLPRAERPGVFAILAISVDRLSSLIQKGSVNKS